MNSAGYQSPVLFRISKVALVVALSLSIGLHWALLQTVAWTGMVMNYSQTAPLTEALEKTFDGKHPCKLCKLVDEGKRSEKKQEAQKPVIKLEVFLSASAMVLYLPQFDPPSVAVQDPRAARFQTPPTPPPRQA